jgi:hypothetical protein
MISTTIQTNTNTSPIGTYANPAPIGVTLVTTILSKEDVFTTFDSYDAKVTILEVVRGNIAQERITTVNPAYAKSPDSGLEYLLARITFGYYARELPGTRKYELKGTAFTAFSTQSIDYATPEVISPKPEVFDNIFSSGDLFEVWLIVRVAIDDKKPTLFFNQEKWFKLY